MRTRHRSRVAAVLFCVSSALGCAPTQHGAVHKPTRLRAASATALLAFVKDAAVALHPKQPKLEPQIIEARSAQAIRKLIDGEIEMAFMSRSLRAADLTEAEKKHRALHMVVVGAEALAVIVHPSNPLADLSSAQLRDIFFTGAITDWTELTAGQKVGPIHVLAVNPKTSGTGELFAASIAGDDKQPYLATARLADYSDSTVFAVAGDPEAISFTGMGNVTTRVRPIELNGVAASAKTVLDTSYVLNRKLFAISDGPPKGEAREFLKFLLSEAGQHIARESGVTPIALD